LIQGHRGLSCPFLRPQLISSPPPISAHRHSPWPAVAGVAALILQCLRPLPETRNGGQDASTVGVRWSGWEQMILVFLLMQRQFISGMTEGAVKR